MINCDLYHGEKPEQIERVVIFWSDDRLCFWGWAYINNSIVGDFNAPTLQEIEKTFSHLKL